MFAKLDSCTVFPNMLFYDHIRSSSCKKMYCRTPLHNHGVLSTSVRLQMSSGIYSWEPVSRSYSGSCKHSSICLIPYKVAMEKKTATAINGTTYGNKVKHVHNFAGQKTVWGSSVCQYTRPGISKWPHWLRSIIFIDFSLNFCSLVIESKIFNGISVLADSERPLTTLEKSHPCVILNYCVIY